MISTPQKNISGMVKINLMKYWQGIRYSHDSLKYIVNFGLEYFYPMPVRQLKKMRWTQAKTMYYNLFVISTYQSLSDDVKYHIAFSHAGDTLNLLQRNREIIELQTKYETERKEGQIQALSQDNAFKELKLRQSRVFFSVGRIGGSCASLCLADHPAEQAPQRAAKPAFAAKAVPLADEPSFYFQLPHQHPELHSRRKSR